MPQTRVRVVGSGFTTFNYQGQPIAFLDTMVDSGQAPLGGGNPGGPGFEAIIPIGARFPVEIATSRVLGPGTLTLSIRELWNEPVWWQLAGLAGTNDQIALWERLAQNPTDVTCQEIIKPPGSSTWRGKTFHGCVVVGVDDGDTIRVADLSVSKNITVAYTHATYLRQGVGGR